jgi:hypothetical protein
MKVKELIEKLKTMNQDAIVLVDGYEGGMSELKDSSVTAIKAKDNNPVAWYYGPFESDDNGVDCVSLSR